MERCIHRVKITKGVNSAFKEALVGSGIRCVVFAGESRQDFSTGLCRKLSCEDIGPMACLQPNKNEKNCPDIAHLRDIK